MSLHILKWIRGWRLDKFFDNLKNHVDKIAISITQAVKTASEGSIIQTIASIIDESLGNHVATEVVTIVKAASFRALAAELAVQGLPDDPTSEDILKFEQEVYAAITGHAPAEKSKLWTSFAASIYGIIKPYVDAGADTLTFAQIVNIIESAYQSYLKDLAESGQGG